MSDSPTKLSHIEVERRIIFLMLRNNSVVEEFVNSGFTANFFDEVHREIVQSIYDEFITSEGKRILTREHYKNRLLSQDKSKETFHELGLFDKCYFVQSPPTVDDVGMLMRQLTESYLGRATNKYLEEFRKDQKQYGYSKAVRSLTDKFQSALGLTETKHSEFHVLSDMKDKYVQDLDRLRKNPAERITCGWPEIDEAIPVGFRPGHLTLFAADTGGHKCVPEHELCNLADGRLITIKELYNDFCNGKSINLLSLNDESKKIIDQPVLSIVSNGIKQCFKIKTNLGFYSEATGNHPYLTPNGYVCLDELKEGDWVAISRKGYFGKKRPDYSLCEWLGGMISEGGTTQKTYTFTNSDPEIVQVISRATIKLGGKIYPITCHDQTKEDHYGVSGMLSYGRLYKIDGVKATKKSIPDEVFTWSKSRVRRFLQVLYGGDGSFVVSNQKNRKNKYRYSIVYGSSSFTLANQVRDLLIKFGIVAKLTYLPVKYKYEIRDHWQVKIRDSEQIIKFIKNIGFCGAKQTKAENALLHLMSIKSNRNKDLIPSTIWNLLDRKFKEHKISHYKCRRLLRKGGDQGRSKEGCCGTKNKSMNRNLLKKIAKLLNNDLDLLKEVESDILWDRVEKIEKSKECETYDICMPKYHNFVVNNFITHNSNVMLNIALNLYEKYGHNILFVPIEMSWSDLTNRLMANLTNIPLKYIGEPSLLTDEQFEKIKEASLWMERSNKFAVLDVSEKTSVSVLRAEIEKRINFFKPKLVVIDYVALMSAEKNFYGRNDLEIGHILKSLRLMGKRYGFHIFSAAQIGRGTLTKLRQEGFDASHIDSTALRGSHEYSADADTIFALLPVPDEEDKLKVYVVKARHGKKGITRELHLKADCCRISSTDPSNFDDSDNYLDSLENDLNEPPEESMKQLENIKSNLTFTSSVESLISNNLDDVDDVDIEIG